jgi:hypothetical protein
MPLEHERSFSADSAVGRYWLLNCVGFRVEGALGSAGIVEEVGLGPDGVDVLAVRRRGILRGVALVPAQRVESVHPWEDTIVLASRHRHDGDRRAEHAQHVTRRLRPLGRAAAVATGRALRDAATVVMQLLSVIGTFLLGLAVVVREHAPHARRHVSNTAAALTLIARAYASEAKRAWRAEKEAIAAWRESRREHAEEPGDDAPLTRASTDDVDARRRETTSR